MNIYLIILGVIAYIVVSVVGSYFMYKSGVYLATRSLREKGNYKKEDKYDRV